MPDLESRLAALESRLRQAEDQLAIYQLIATYGPAVDGLVGEAVQDLWTDDGVYDTQSRCFTGRDEVGTIVDTPQHRGYVDNGSAHVMSLPHVVVDGDRAVATGYSQVYTRRGGHWRVERSSSNRWEFVRTLKGWKASHRLNRLLDGSEAPREILAQGVRRAS